MKVLQGVADFAAWRAQARALLQAHVPPHQVAWEDEAQPQLFGIDPEFTAATSVTSAPAIRVPPGLLDELRLAACYRTPGRWNLLYRILWRVTHGERQAMLAGDPDGSQLHKRLKSVSREAHHLHAFLRFRPCEPGGNLDYVAWYEPAHDILETASEHFIHRLGRQRWLIATPLDAVWFDGERLEYRRPCPPDWAVRARQDQVAEDGLWQSYYSSIFNPARLNPQVMQGHMPRRFWSGLPEGKLIPLLVSDARAGAQRTGQAQALVKREGKRIRGSVERDGGSEAAS
jgi:uracil-DNA glycosylase